MFSRLLNITAFTLFSVAQAQIYQTPVPAVCVVPVADLLVEPMNTYNLNADIKKAYHELPISWGRHDQDKKVCPRAHQLLFNEVVSILEEHEDEFLIEVPNIIYEIPFDTTIRKTFWILKSNIMPLDQIASHNCIHAIPDPITQDKSTLHNENVVVVTIPFSDPMTQKTYSAGTRFTRLKKYDTTTTYAVYILDPRNMLIKTTSIEKEICKMVDASQTRNEQIQHFISLLTAWANPSQGCIPCIFGGCSFIALTKDMQFAAAHKKVDDEILEYWYRNDMQAPFTGFDSSNIILRAAQICGLPYFYKNTYTAARHMQEFSENDEVSLGDFIWIKGGLFVVSSLKPAKVINAFSYSSGYGRVIELSLAKVFKNMRTFDDLLHAYFMHQPLEILARDGSISREIIEFKLLKLAAIFDNLAS